MIRPLKKIIIQHNKFTKQVLFFTVVDSDSNMVIVSDSYLETSPDEQIIRQRSSPHLLSGYQSFSSLMLNEILLKCIHRVRYIAAVYH